MLSMLSGCRVRSKPSRVKAWVSDTVAHSGAATAPAVRSARVAGTGVVTAMADMTGSSKEVVCPDVEPSMRQGMQPFPVAMLSRRWGDRETTTSTRGATMRYLMIQKPTDSHPDEKLFAEMGAFIEELTAAGVL